MKKIKVLIADDNIEIAKMIKYKLEENIEFEVLDTCYSDNDEIKLIEKLDPDVVITDLVRNGRESGIDIIKMYKAKEKNIKFLVISASDFKAEYINIIDGFIKKPIKDLEVIVKELYRLKKDI